MKNIDIFDEELDLYDINCAVDMQVRFHRDFSKNIKDGSLGYILNSRSLLAAQKLKLLSMGFTYKHKNKKENLVALAYGISHHIALHTPFLNPLTESFNTVDTYPIYLGICIHPDIRRRGLATCMLSALLERAVAQKFKTALIDCSSADRAAKTFLSSIGFEDTGLIVYTDRLVFMKILNE